MSPTTVVLYLGVATGLGMMAWGAFGALSGRVLTKAYGDQSQGRAYRYVRRDAEPIWFWTLCGIYFGIGAMIFTTVSWLLQRFPTS